MGKFDGVLLASDFDNTILNTERPRRTGCPIPPISQRNVEALRYFMDNGGRFAVATGRALPAFRMFAEQVPMLSLIHICSGRSVGISMPSRLPLPLRRTQISQLW